MKNFFKFLLLNLLFSVGLAFAPQSQFIEPKFDEIRPLIIAYCVIQDSRGFMWIGDQGGLVRYDGYDLKRYTQIPFDTTSLSSNWVQTIKEDNKGNLWIGTWGGGLNYFNQKTEKFIQYTHENNKSNSSKSYNISSILINKDGSLWLGTQDPGLIHMSFDSVGKPSNKYYNLSGNPEPPVRSGENFVLALFKDSRNKLWIGTIEGGLTVLDPETDKIQNFKHEPGNPTSLSSNTVSSICEDEFGNIWVGTGHFSWPYGRGLNKLDPNTGQFLHYRYDPDDPSSICSDNISSLLIDRDGVFWIGTVNNHLNAIPLAELLSNRKPRFTHYSNFSRRCINSIDEDRLGNIWISLFGRAVYKYNRLQNPFIWYRHIRGNSNSLSSNGVGMVQADKSGNIWFGGRGGVLDCYDPKTGQFTHYSYNPDNPSGLNSDIVTSICEDQSGYYWIGTMNGLNRLNPETGVFDHIQKDPENPYGLKSNKVNDVITRRSGDIWIASYKKGIQLYDIDENLFYHFDLDTSSTLDEGTTGIYEDHTGTLWSQTFNYGFYGLRVNDHQISSVKHFIHDPNNRKSLSYNSISDIIRPQVVDTSALWIATGHGLNRLDLKTEEFTHFYVEDGLPSNMILKVLEDDDGNIWCSCAIGIAVYDMNTGKIKSYDKGDGMPINRFGSRPQNACKTSNGQLIFGSGRGALGFHPEQLKSNQQIPPIRITDFKIFNKSIKLDTAIQFKKRIVLTYDQNMFSFEFAALNYTNPEKNQYAYLMEGLYDDWIQLDHDRTVSFTNLDPGEYIFRVKGSNNHGIWNEKGISVQVIITPPWWQTSWAYFSYTLLFGTFVIGTVRFEVRRRQRKIKNQLQRERELRTIQEAEHRAVVAELQSKAEKVQKEKEKEQMRSRIASDLHDEIGSNLSSIAIVGQMVQEKINVSSSMKKRVQEIPRIARMTAESMRDIVWFINPDNDDMDKLLAKMRDTTNLMLERTNFTFTAPQNMKSLETDLNFRRNLYLFYKECLQNVVRHSKAEKVEIDIRHKDYDLNLSVADNGVGFETGREYNGNGLKNLERRAAEMGAEMQINAQPGSGTNINLTVKIP